jgi:excisionase family DNA binding protein
VGDALMSRVVEAPAGAGHRLVVDVQDTEPGVPRRSERVPERLRRRVNELVARALEESLSARTAEGRRLRMAIVGRLARLEMDEADADEVTADRAGRDALAAEDALLTTAQVAELLQMSRPYVAMLCDTGKLGEVTMTEGKHRRIRRSAVEAFLAAQASGIQGAETPRQAGAAAGLYERDDAEYVEAGRRHTAPAPRPVGRVRRTPPK